MLPPSHGPTALAYSRVPLRRRAGFAAAVGLAYASLQLHTGAAEIPKVGDEAPDFALKGLDDKLVHLSDLHQDRRLVLVVLRGWPGYQCPVCDMQVRDFTKSASDFIEAKASVVFVYPGPAGNLKAHAEEFKGMKGREWPSSYQYLLDPGYTLVNAYGLRWDAPNETAYPATFVINAKGVITSATVSHSHGGRESAKAVLETLSKPASK